MTAGVVGPDQRGDLHLLVEEGLLPVERTDVAPPLDLFVGHAERPEHLVVEACPPMSRSCTAFRNMPDSAPWMIRWS